MKIEIKETHPDGLLININEIYVDTYEEVFNIIRAVENTNNLNHTVNGEIAIHGKGMGNGKCSDSIVQSESQSFQTVDSLERQANDFDSQMKSEVEKSFLGRMTP